MPVTAVGTTFRVTLIVTNQGDSATFADTVVTLLIPTLCAFVSVSASGWTVAYSTNGGSSYSGSAPGDLTTVTHVRLTRSTFLNADSAAPTITLTLTAVEAGAIEVIASVATAGVTDQESASLFALPAYTP